MDINQANINNLKSLWKKYGADKLAPDKCSQQTNEQGFYVNKLWPNRCWFDGNFNINNIDDLSILSKLAQDSLFPILPTFVSENNQQFVTQPSNIEHWLLENNWCKALEQTAMCTTLDSCSLLTSKNNAKHADFCVKKLETAVELSPWFAATEMAFGYCIDRSVIENLVEDSDIQLLLGLYQGQAIASALINKTDDVIGIHQVGVKPDFQGQGLASIFMREILSLCQSWQGKYAVLQASELGKPLYERLGFTAQFIINSYQQSHK